MRAVCVALILASAVTLASAEEYRIGNSDEPVSAPVYLTRPVTGSVEVTNLPDVQAVRIVNGKEGATEVTGEVSIKTTAPIQVEVTNPSASDKGPPEVRLSGPLKLDDTQPVRVWVDNSWNPENPAGQEYAAFAFQHRFLPGDERHRRQVLPVPTTAGKVFLLTDLIADVRPDAQLKVRLLTSPRSVGGMVKGVEFAEFPIAVVDTRRATSLHFATPVPVTGEFTVEVEILSANQGGYFSAVAMGYFSPRL